MFSNNQTKTTVVHLPAQWWFFIALTFLMSKLANCQIIITFASQSFRKNIGRSLLRKDDLHHPYAEKWEYDTTSREGKRKYAHLLDVNFEKALEKRISEYIQQNLSFVVFEVKTKNDRLFWESRIISTLSNAAKAGEIKPSENWLGSYSPNEKIRESGLWLVNELYKQSLNDEEFEKLKNLVEGK